MTSSEQESAGALIEQLNMYAHPRYTTPGLQAALMNKAAALIQSQQDEIRKLENELYKLEIDLEFADKCGKAAK